MSTTINALWKWPLICVLGLLWAVAALLSFVLGGLGKTFNRMALWALEMIEAL